VRHWLVRATAFAVLVGGASLAYAYSTGPPFARTNGWAVASIPKESVCSVCHNGNGTLPDVDPNGSVHLIGVPAQYAPGQVYPLEVHLDYNWSADPFGGDTPRKWGFQVTAVSATAGDSAGYWSTPGVAPDLLQETHAPGTSVFKTRSYLEHTAFDIHVGENQDGHSGPIVWHFSWVAPPADIGKVYFFLTGNAANGDATAFGSDDHIYSTSDSTVGGGVAAVYPPPHLGEFATSLARPFQNPMSKCTNLQLQIGKPGLVDLAVFDLSGRRVRTIVHEHLEHDAYGLFWDTRDDARRPVKNGVYFVRLLAPGLQKPIAYRLVVAR